MSKALPLLELTWLDASVITQGDWLTLDEIVEEAKRPERSLNVTIGWLLWEDKTALVVGAQSAMVHEDKPSFDLVMYIPKVLVKKRRCLKTS